MALYKLDPKQSRVMSGAIVRLGDMQIGKFTDQITQFALDIETSKRAFSYVAGGEAAGGGRFTKGMTESVVLWVQGSMRGEERKKRYRGPSLYKPNLSADYERWKDKLFSGRPIMTLTGASAAAFGPISLGGSKIILGFSQAKKASNRPIALNYGSKGTGGGPSISPHVYMAAHEGFSVSTRIPTRPIVTGSILGWMYSVYPRWGRLFEEMMTKFWGVASKEVLTGLDNTVTKKDAEGDIIGRSAIDEPTSKSAEEVALQNEAKLKQGANKLDKLAYLLQSRVDVSTGTLSKNYEKIVRAGLLKSGLTSEEVDEVIRKTNS